MKIKDIISQNSLRELREYGVEDEFKQTRVVESGDRLVVREDGDFIEYKKQVDKYKQNREINKNLYE